MFPDFPELLTSLRNSDAQFTRLFDNHNELDQRIKDMEANIELAPNDEIEVLKKEKLHIKDEIYSLLKKKSA